jgi:transposase
MGPSVSGTNPSYELTHALSPGQDTTSGLFVHQRRLPLMNTAPLWRSMSRRRTGMTSKPSFRFCANSPMEVSRGPALGDLGYRGKRLAEAGQVLGISVEAIARGRDGRFVPAGICWVVERSFAWLSRYRRLNTIFERSKEHLIAFVAIAFISILSRRLKRLVVEEVSA